MPRPLLPPWLRRGLEAAIVAAIVGIASLVGRFDTGGPPFPLPSGLTGSLLLAPAVVALSVVTTAYPVAMAATRGDAVMGLMAAYLVAADLVIVFSGPRVVTERLELTLPGGVLVALLALLPVGAALAASQLGASLGFGRRAGAVAAVVGAVAAAIVLVVFGVVL